MWKIIGRLIAIVGIIGGLIYGTFYLWSNRYEYFFQGDEIEVTENSDETSSNDGLLDNMDKEAEGDDSSDMGDDLDDEEDSSDASVEDYVIPVINESDCKDECSSKQGVEIEYKYCREICGLNENSEIKNTTENDDSSEDIGEDDIEGDECDDIDDAFEEDVCWKKKAIEEKNAKYCDEIYSEALGRVCQDRVLEEILN
jgi:hypothetical protein